MEQKKLPITIKWGFGVSNMFLILGNALITSYLSFYITDIAKLDVSVYALAESVGSIASTAMLFIGMYLMQYAHMRWGKYRSWYVICAPMFAIGMILFSMTGITAGLSAGVKSAMIVGGWLLISISYYMLYTVSPGLMSKVTNDPQERASMAAILNALFGVGRIIGAPVLAALVAFFGGTLVGTGYAVYFISTGVLVILVYYIFAGLTKEYDPFEPIRNSADGTDKKRSDKITIGEILKTFASCPSLLFYFVGDVLFRAASKVEYAAAAYFFRYICGSMSFYTMYITATPIAAVISSMVTPLITKRFEKKKLHMFSNIGIATLYFGMFLIYKITGTMNPYVAIGMAVCAFFLNNFFFAVQSMFYVDCGDYMHAKTGNDVMGITISLIGLPMKLNALIGAPIAAALLKSGGYVGGAETQTAECMDMIAKMWTLSPVIGNLIQFFCVWLGYKLTKTVMDEVRIKLEEMKAAKEA